MHIRNIFPDNGQYIINIHELLSSFSEIKFSRDEMLNGGVLDYLWSLALREIQNDSTT